MQFSDFRNENGNENGLLHLIADCVFSSHTNPYASVTSTCAQSLRKIQKTEQITRDFCCIFYRFVDFLTLNTLTQLYLKNLYTFRTNIVSRRYRIIKGLWPTVIRICLCFGQRTVFSVIFTFASLCQRS